MFPTNPQEDSLPTCLTLVPFLLSPSSSSPNPLLHSLSAPPVLACWLEHAHRALLCGEKRLSFLQADAAPWHPAGERNACGSPASTPPWFSPSFHSPSSATWKGQNSRTLKVGTFPASAVMLTDTKGSPANCPVHRGSPAWGEQRRGSVDG